MSHHPNPHRFFGVLLVVAALGVAACESGTESTTPDAAPTEATANAQDPSAPLSDGSAGSKAEALDPADTVGAAEADDDVPHTHGDERNIEPATGDRGELFAYLEAYDTSNDNVTIAWDDEAITIAGNGLPDFDTGEFPNSGNPNTISAQDVSYTIPLDPVYTGEPTEVREPGTSLAGIKFEPGTAERDPGTSAPIEAFQDLLDLGLDFNNAHVQPDGTYHFHGVPEPLDDSDGAEHSALVGFMHDGFPVYALYGHGSAETADGTVREITSSWQLREGERADGEPAGTYDGTYTGDYDYVEGSGDLDECNGTFTVTPEYPDGTYAYFITDTFPYISRCLMGELDETALTAATGPPPGGPPSGGAAS
jgi:hypothetical protein